ncbi:hypothetical protein QQP08_016872, partial [Theobroma cacao]
DDACVFRLRLSGGSACLPGIEVKRKLMFNGLRGAEGDTNSNQVRCFPCIFMEHVMAGSSNPALVIQTATRVGSILLNDAMPYANQNLSVLSSVRTPDIVR